MSLIPDLYSGSHFSTALPFFAVSPDSGPLQRFPLFHGAPHGVEVAVSPDSGPLHRFALSRAFFSCVCSVPGFRACTAVPTFPRRCPGFCSVPRFRASTAVPTFQGVSPCVCSVPGFRASTPLSTLLRPPMHRGLSGVVMSFFPPQVFRQQAVKQQSLGPESRGRYTEQRRAASPERTRPPKGRCVDAVRL